MSKVSYCFCLPPGDYERQALYLLRSIEKNTKADPDEIFVFVAEEEKEGISEDTIEEVEKKATLIEGNIPNPDYLLSSSHEALRKASKITEKEYIALLDTDTLVLDDINLPRETEVDLFLKPADLGNRYWARKESLEEWKSLFSEYGFDFPEKRINATVDGLEMIPYYNSGSFIVNTASDFPDEWLELSKEIHGNLSDNFFTDQVSLAMLASKYNVQEVGEVYNFPLNLRISPDKDAMVVHYKRIHSVYRSILIDPWFKSKIEDTGILQRYKEDKSLKLYKYMLRDLLDGLYLERKEILRGTGIAEAFKSKLTGKT